MHMDEAIAGKCVRDIMRHDVVSVASDQTIQDVAEALTKRSIHGVPVIDRDSTVVGIVTESDFFMKDRASWH